MNIPCEAKPLAFVIKLDAALATSKTIPPAKINDAIDKSLFFLYGDFDAGIFLASNASIVGTIIANAQNTYIITIDAFSFL